MDLITFLPPLLIVPAMGILSRVRSSTALGCEIRRKALHVGVGLASLAFPMLLTEAWMVITALLMVAAWMIAVRGIPALKRHFGAVLHGAGRISHGELYFALAIGGLLLLAEDRPLLFVVPVLILTISDAAAAIVGRAFPRGLLTGLARGKTMSGSAAFLATAFPCTLVPLLHYTNLTLTASMGIALVIAAGTCLAEAISQRGRDNIMVPIAAFVPLSVLPI